MVLVCEQARRFLSFYRRCWFELLEVMGFLWLYL